MEFIKKLEWRYATKKFNPTKKVPDHIIDQLKKAVQLSVSSYGLQLYKVLIISDEKLKEKLRAVSWGQSQISDASHVFVFCNYTGDTDSKVDEHVARTAEIRQMDEEKAKGYGDFMKKKIAEKTDDEKEGWLKSQTYLALGNLLTACAELRIDACPIEGFEPEKYNEILGLEEKGLNAAVVAAVGYRHEEDPAQNFAKVRKPIELLFEEI